MAKVTVMPLIGEIRRERLNSLAGCHVLYERSAVRAFDTGAMHVAIDRAIKELMLADRHLAFSGKMTFVVQIELEPT